MKRLSQRTLAFLLLLAMVLTMLPVGVLADSPATRASNFATFYSDEFDTLNQWASIDSQYATITSAGGTITAGGMGAMVLKDYTVPAGDAVYEFVCQPRTDIDSWAGIQFNLSQTGYTNWTNDGYFLYIRADGDMNLHKGGESNPIATGKGNGCDGTTPITVRVEYTAPGDQPGQIRAYVNNSAEPVLTAEDSSFNGGMCTVVLNNSSMDSLTISCPQTVLAPMPAAERRIYQRGTDNTADVRLEGYPQAAGEVLEARLMSNGTVVSDWTALEGGACTFTDVPAGGWYSVEMQRKDSDGNILGSGTVVERIGVGDVFLTSGQSNSVCFGSTPTSAQYDTVATCHGDTGLWYPCNDPQPANSAYAGSGGSPWPTLGDKLTEELGVPIGFVLTGYGGAAVSQFNPDTADSYYSYIKSAIEQLKKTGGFKAVLWHQGETDNYTRTSTADYQAMLQKIIDATRQDAGFTVPWVIANVTYHPDAATPVNDAIRAAQEAVCNGTDIFLGPDTDTLVDGYRSDDRIHFNEAGLKAHGAMWAEVLLDCLYSIDPPPEVDIDDMTHVAFSDDFNDQDITNAQWFRPGTVSGSQYKVDLGAGALTGIDRVFDNAVYEFTMGPQGEAHWVGFLFNRPTVSGTWDDGGYMLYLRSDKEAGATAGTVELMLKQDQGATNVASGMVEGYQNGNMVDFKVAFVDGTVTVWANGEKILTYTDPDKVYLSGYAGFAASGTAGYGLIDDMTIKTLPPAADDDETIRETFGEIKEALDDSVIYLDDTAIDHLPLELPEGYSYAVKASSDTSVVQVGGTVARKAQASNFGRMDGIVTPPAEDTEVTVTWAIAYTFNNQVVKSEDYSVTYDVKAAITPEDTAHFLDEKYGLFVHYVWAGSPAGNIDVHAMTPNGTKATSIDEMIEEFNAERFAQDCKDWGMQYVIFTVWHYQMNPVYPSQVYKEWRDPGVGGNNLPTDDGQHDLIDKIYQELSKQGIDLYLYTHPYDLHDFTATDKAKFGYDSQGDLDFEYDKWNEYLNEQYKELCERYKGKIKGMFVDEGLANPANNLSVDYERLRDTVKSVDPSLVMIQNEYHGPYTCDTSMWELPTCSWHGGIHNNLGTWQTNTIPIGTSIGNIDKPYEYSWWATRTRGSGTAGQESAENIFLYTVLEAGVNTEGGGIAWAAGPYMGSDQYGIWEDGVYDTMVQAYEYLKPIENSVKNTRPSQSYPTPPYSTYNTIDWGVATESPDGETTYLHVLKPGQGNTLTIAAPADGKVFSSARLLVSGAAVGLEQTDAGVTLTLPATASWDALDTVIVLETDRYSPLYSAIAAAETAMETVPQWLQDADETKALLEAIAAARLVTENENAADEDISAATAALESAQEAWAAANQPVEEPKSDNLALGKSATYSSTLEDPKWNISYVTDGLGQNDAQIGWTSDPHYTDSDHTEWIQVDLASQQTVGRIDLTPAKEAGYGFPEDFRVEVSTDGNEYTKIYEQTGYHSDGSELVIYCDPQQVRYVKITATKLTPDQALSGSATTYSYRMQLAEIEVYAPTAAQSAQAAAQAVAGAVEPVSDPVSGQTAVALPAVRDGYTISMISGNPAVIAQDGTITAPETDTEVTLQFLVQDADGIWALTEPTTVIVPGTETAPGSDTGTVTRYTITVTQSEGGTISPSTTRVTRGGSKTFTITTEEGYKISDVLVDGKSVGAVSTYTFKNVTAKHTITAKFEKSEESTNVAGFIDVKSTDWFAEAVQYAVDEGLMNGTSSTTFSPKGATTRGMIVTILARMAGVDTDGGATWYEKGRAWAMANGISDGTNMEKAITREQLATMLYRYAELMGEDVSKTTALDGFQDGGKVSAYAAEALKWAAAEGIVTGKTGGVIDPQAGATRAEAAAMLMRFAKQ